MDATKKLNKINFVCTEYNKKYNLKKKTIERNKLSHYNKKDNDFFSSSVVKIEISF